MKPLAFTNLAKLSIPMGFLTFAFGCANTSKKPDPYVVEAVGVGDNCELAIKNAKQNAVEQVTGTFVQGKRSLVGDRYSESMDELTGGTIKWVKVLERLDGKPCNVKIEAFVEQGNLQLSEAKPSQFFDLGQISIKDRKRDESKKMLSTLIDRPWLIRVGFNDLRWSHDQNQYVTMNYSLTKLEPMSKWFLDLEDFFRVQGDFVVYKNRSSSPNLIENLIGGRDTLRKYSSVDSFEQDSEICFSDQDYSAIRCYKSTVAHYAMTMLDSMYLVETILNQDGHEISRREIKPSKLGMYVRKGFEQKYISRQGTTHVFNMVAEPDLPIPVSSRLPLKSLSSGATLEISVGFRGQ